MHASPVQLQCCLHLSRRPRLSDRSKSTAHECVRAVEVGVIKSIEHIQTELESYAFSYREVLLNTHIPVPVAGRPQIREISWCIPQAIGLGNCESRRVKPLGTAGMARVVIANHIHMLTGSVVIDSVACAGDGQRKSLFQCQCAGSLPT